MSNLTPLDPSTLTQFSYSSRTEDGQVILTCSPIRLSDAAVRDEAIIHMSQAYLDYRVPPTELQWHCLDYEFDGAHSVYLVAYDDERGWGYFLAQEDNKVYQHKLSPYVSRNAYFLLLLADAEALTALASLNS